MTQSEEKLNEPVILAKITGHYGVKGWLKIFSYTDPQTAILNYQKFLIYKHGYWENILISEAKKHGKKIIVKIEGIDDREIAEDFIGLKIGIFREKLPTLEGDQYYWADLEGLKVIDSAGKLLGKVSYILKTGANDVLVVQEENAEKEILIPFVFGNVILDVNLSESEIKVDWQWD